MGERGRRKVNRFARVARKAAATGRSAEGVCRRSWRCLKTATTLDFEGRRGAYEPASARWSCSSPASPSGTSPPSPGRAVPRGPSPKSPIAQIERRAPRFFSPRERRSGPPRRGSTCFDARRAGRPGLASARRGRRRSPRVRESAGCNLPRRARPNSGRPSRGGAAARVSSGEPIKSFHPGSRAVDFDRPPD